jgi:integrase
MKWGLVSRNVATLVDLPPVRRAQVKVLEPEQAAQLIRAASTHRFGCAYVVALALGFRLGEVLGLKWEDVDFERNTVSIRRALQRFDGKLNLVDPKTEASQRTVEVPGFVRAILLEHRRGQAVARRSASENWQDQDLVFTTSRGTPLDARNVRREFKNLLSATGLPEIRLHDLRHTRNPSSIPRCEP